MNHKVEEFFKLNRKGVEYTIQTVIEPKENNNYEHYFCILVRNDSSHLLKDCTSQEVDFNGTKMDTYYSNHSTDQANKLKNFLNLEHGDQLVQIMDTKSTPMRYEDITNSKHLFYFALNPKLTSKDYEPSYRM